MQLKHHKKFLEKHDKLKTCIYPECFIVFYGRGKSKYCPEHRKKEYKSKKYIIKNPENTNQIIPHNDIYCHTKICKCAVDGCNNTFEIKLVPRVYTYPKFCPDHRNEYKRLLFKINIL
jgi:hypothetical protein